MTESTWQEDAEVVRHDLIWLAGRTVEAESVQALARLIAALEAADKEVDHLMDRIDTILSPQIAEAEQRVAELEKIVFWLLQGHDDAVFASSQDMARWVSRARRVLDDGRP